MLIPKIRTIGDPLLTYQLNLKRRSAQVLIIDWYDDQEKTDPADELNGLTVSLYIGPRSEPVRKWDSTLSENTVTWDIDPSMTDFVFDRYTGTIVLVDSNGEESVLMALQVVIAPAD